MQSSTRGLLVISSILWPSLALATPLGFGTQVAQAPVENRSVNQSDGVAARENQDTPGFFDMKKGTTTQITGSASEQGGANNESAKLRKCKKSLGTIAVVQPQDFTIQALSRYNLPSPSNLLRLMIQQSGCFQVVERGLGMQNLMQERELSQSGMLKRGSNVGGGQMITADFVLTPEVQISEKDEGSLGLGAVLGAVGGLVLGPLGAVTGVAASNVKFSQAATTLILSDARSGLQVAAATGSVEKTDYPIGGILGSVGLGTYGNTPEGEVISASMLANFNELVDAIKDSTSLISSSAGAQAGLNAQDSTQATPKFSVGDVFLAKISGVKVLAAPEKASKTLYKLSKGEEVVLLEDEKNGMLKIQGEKGEGWVDIRLMRQ